MAFKRFFQIFILPLLALLALLNFYKDFSWNELIEGLGKCKFYWIVLATGVHLLNHFFRAYRWGLLISLRGFYVSTWHCVLAEMTGFFSNLFVPRLGEWTRCSTLRHMDYVPIKDSLPTVIVERTIDIFVFLGACMVVCLTAFLLKEEMAKSLFLQFFQRIGSFFRFSSTILFKLLLVSILVSVGLFYLYRLARERFQHFFAFCIKLLYSTKTTLFSINSTTWLFTFLIWFSYFLVEYISCFALETTSQLGFFPIFCIFIVINLGTAIPVPGNIGAYHVLMYFALSVFKVDHESAMIYVTITHGIQVFNALVVGGLCAVVSGFMGGKSVDGKVSTKVK